MGGRRAAVMLAILTAILGWACGAPSAPQAAPTPCATPAGVSVAGLPKDLMLQSFGTVTEVGRRAGYIGAEFVTEESVIELYPRMVRELGERGYTFVGGDNEGFEAELAFVDGKKRNVSFSVRQGCGEQNIVKVLVQEDVGG